MAIQLTSKYEGLKPSDIVSLEDRLSMLLPDDFKTFLLNYNVAKPEPNQLIVPGVTTSIDQFLGVSDLPDEDLFAQRELYSGRVPDQLLVIAQCGGGNLICIDHQSSGAFFWDHEKEGTGEQLVLEVARTFVALRELLLPYRPGDFVSDSRILGVSKRPDFAEKFKKFM